MITRAEGWYAKYKFSDTNVHFYEPVAVWQEDDYGTVTGLVENGKHLVNAKSIDNFVGFTQEIDDLTVTQVIPCEPGWYAITFSRDTMELHRIVAWGLSPYRNHLWAMSWDSDNGNVRVISAEQVIMLPGWEVMHYEVTDKAIIDAELWADVFRMLRELSEKGGDVQ